ncbi:MAG: serine/threonine protein kinase [Deltaproteobacteria bacterium]|nr:serine/threonine protein kinase [Deltaproteobacteria bacterium]
MTTQPPPPSSPPPAQPDSLAPGTAVLGGRFRVERLLGSGGMGLVYLAEQVSLGRKVALKVLRNDLSHEGMKERFHREALLLSSVEHSGVVRVIDFGHHEGSACLVMEYVEGESLEAVLQREAPLSVERAERVLDQLAQGLVAIHAKGIIHRDLKPENVTLTRTGDGREQARLLDFGIARLAEPEAGDSVTRLGFILGTPEYMSPEQAMGQPLDARSDLYALGLIAFRMLAGRHPLPGPSPLEYVSQQIHLAPPSLLEAAPTLSSAPHLLELVAACLAKAPDARPQTAQVFLERLSGRSPVPLVQTLTSLQRAQAAAEPVSGVCRRKVALKIGALALVAAALATVALVLWFQPERRARRLLEERRGSEALQVIDDAGEAAQSWPLKMLRASALYQVGRHDEARRLLEAVPAETPIEPAAAEAMADDFGHHENRPEGARTRKVLAGWQKVRVLPLLQELARQEQSWAQWGALRFVDLEHAGQGLPLATLYIAALDSRDCGIRAIAAKRLADLRSELALEPLRKLKKTPRKKALFADDECGQDAAALALQRLERELTP